MASPSHALGALNLIGSFFKNCQSAGSVVFSYFNGLGSRFRDAVRGHYGDRVLFSVVPPSCPHAYDPGIWFFKAYALLAAHELDEPFLYLDSKAAILKDPVEVRKALLAKTRFFVQLPPSPDLANGRWTARSSLRKMDCDADRYRYFSQYLAGIQAYLPTRENWAHIEELHRLMLDPGIAGPSRIVNRPDGPTGMCFEHRGDQSVLSTLIERNRWHQPYDPGLYLKYGDIATARHYVPGSLQIPVPGSVVVDLRHGGIGFVPPELMAFGRDPEH